MLQVANPRQQSPNLFASGLLNSASSLQGNGLRLLPRMPR
jgi:hypothetical protein